jgi:hypothetical protein
MRAPAEDVSAEPARLLLARERIRFTIIDDFGTAENGSNLKRGIAVLEKAKADPLLSHLI